MNLTLVARIDTTLLYLPFFERLMAMLDEAHSLGAHYWAISGHRSYAEQTRLYEQGRTAPGPIVTNAKAGESAHNFGLAVDFCRDAVLDRKGLQPDWKPESYDLLGELCTKHGLTWGGHWKTPDRPHVQWGNRVTSAQLEPVRDRFEAGGLRAVWEYLDREA